jgi:pyruvate dehydrogenase E1 component alpha subunit
MMMIRAFENQVYSQFALPRQRADGSYEARIGGFVHLCDGQEAIAVGMGEVFRQRVDALVGGPRSHGHALAIGASPLRVMAELFGRAGGCCGGRAGSVGLSDASVGYLGAYHVAGAQAPVGIGAAFTFQYRGNMGCSFILLGDGALNQGTVHESLNLASLYKLPAVFIVEDNGMALGTRVERHSGDPDLTKAGLACGIPSRSLDGNDVDEVVAVVAEAARRARAGEGPSFLVARTFRLRGFSMSDPMKYRTRDEMRLAAEREPIRTYSRRLKERGWVDERDLEQLAEEAGASARSAVMFAEQSPDPAVETRFQNVFAGLYPPQTGSMKKAAPG